MTVFLKYWKEIFIENQDEKKGQAVEQKIKIRRFQINLRREKS